MAQETGAPLIGAPSPSSSPPEKVVVGGWAWLRKVDLGPDRIAAIRKSLTLTPRPTSEYSKPTQLRLWDETPELLGVPREWFLTNRSRAYEIQHDLVGPEAASGVSTGVVFDGTLRDEQEEAVQRFVGALEGGHSLGGVLQAPPGWGKTAWTLALIQRLTKNGRVPKTLVLVHKEFLTSQWEERIQKFLPRARVGRIQGDLCETSADIVMGMIQSLSQREYQPEVYRSFALVVSDEVHRVAAQTWSSVIPRFTAKWRVGLTATPRRKDCAENAFWWHIGPVLFTAKEVRLVPAIRWVRTGFKFVSVPGEKNLASAPRAVQIRVMCASEMRNRRITDEIRQAVESGRKILVLSERLNHLARLSLLLQGARPGTKADFYVGGRSEDALRESSKAQVIFATSQMASEGLDIPALDTLLMVTPISDPEQAVGRILRPHEGKKRPIVVDLIDDVEWMQNQAERRARMYHNLEARALAAATIPKRAAPVGA